MASVCLVENAVHQTVKHGSQFLPSSRSLSAFLQLQQDICREDFTFQGSCVLQGEEQQSMWELQSGGRGAV